jgi:DNA-binding transcriptional LysR family regulator
VQSPSDIDLVHTDLVIGYERMLPSAEHQVLFRDRWVCAVWSGNTEVGEVLTLDEYKRLPHLGYGASVDRLSGLADQAASARYPQRNVAVSVETFFLIPFLLAGTNMLAFMHEGVGRRLAAISDIRLLEVPFEVPIVAESMFWHSRFTADPAHKWLRKQVADAAAAVRAETDIDTLMRRMPAASGS